MAKSTTVIHPGNRSLAERRAPLRAGRLRRQGRQEVTARIQEGSALCPTCRSNAHVTYQGREGSKSQSKDVWLCSRHGEFRTVAR